MGFSVVGKSIPRVDSLEKVTGKAMFCADIKLPGMLYAKLLRSRHPHARIIGINTSKAENLPGVRCVATGKDSPSNRFGSPILDQTVLARDIVRYVGEPIAAVAAETIETAEEATELIEVEYEELPPVFNTEEAMATNPLVVVHRDLFHYKRGGAFGGPRFDLSRPNVFMHFKIRKGDVDKGFHESDLIVENRFTTARVQHCALEPQAAIAQPTQDGGLTLWVGRQSIYGLQSTIGDIFGIKPSKIRVIQYYVGGGFGLKNNIILEPIVVLLALKTGRPIKLVFTREDVFVHGGNKVPMVIYIKDGAKKDGTLMAREIKVILNGGAYAFNTAVVTRNCSFVAVSMYRIPNFKWDSYGVYTNEVPNSSFRGLGNNQLAWVIESHMDILAEKLGIDPVLIRKRNLLEEGEPNLIGEITHSIGAKECLEKVTKFIKLNDRIEGKDLWKRGKGIALGNKYSIAPTASLARVKVNEDGNIMVFHSADELGQGCNTIAAQIAAEEFGIPVDNVKVISCDTLVTPFFGGGSTASRVTYNLGNAIRQACQVAKRKLFEIAANRLGVSPSELESNGAEVYTKEAPIRKINFTELFLGYRGDRPGGYGTHTTSGEITGDATWVQDYTPEDPDTGQINPVAALQGKRLNAFYTYTAKSVEVAVNVETGEVKVIRCGHSIDSTPLNPKMCEQQMEGGIGMGIGDALYEEVKVEKGVVLNPNFTDYRIPTFQEIPQLKNAENFIIPTPHKDGPFGAKGLGEAAIIGLQPAIANAIYNAVGIRIADLPITPEKILQAIAEKRRKG